MKLIYQNRHHSNLLDAKVVSPILNIYGEIVALESDSIGTPMWSSIWHGFEEPLRNLHNEIIAAVSLKITLHTFPNQTK